MKERLIEKDEIYKGVRLTVVATNMGHRCGYVYLPPLSIFYNCDESKLYDLEVHGGNYME